MKKIAIIGPKITLGSDPEVFLFNPKTGKFISAVDKIGGSKMFPAPMEKEGFFVQEDNVLAEFNIPPAYNESEFVSYLTDGLDQVKRRVPYFDLKIQASAFMPAEELEDPRAQEFGCDPDYNAWTGARNMPPSEEAKFAPLRSAGGHVAVGYDLLDTQIDKEEVDQNIVRWLDLRLGVPSILMDSDKERRKLYGKAGAYRSKSFGVEYRTLSSFWLANQKLMRWVYQNTVKSVKDAGNEMFIDAKLALQVQNCINNADEDLAMNLVLENNLEVV